MPSLAPQSIVFALAALFVADSAVPAADNAATRPIVAPADALVMRPQMLVDPYAQMDAVSILVPEGWKMVGSTNWIPGNAGGPDIDMAVADLAQGAGVRLCPDLYYVDGVRESQKRAMMHNDPSGRMWANLAHFYEEGKMNSPGQEIRQLPKSPRDYVLNVLVPKLRPAIAAAKDVTVISEMDLPDYAKARTEAAATPGVKFTASRFRITYTGPKGPVEEEFVCTIRIFPQQQPFTTTLWDATVTSAWAPKGKLDAVLPTCVAVTASKQMQLPYYNFVMQISQMILQAQRDELQRMIDNENERIRIYGEYQRKASAQLTQKIRDNFKKQQDVKAANHAAFMHYVNDTSPYINPRDGNTLSLPANYKFSYIDNHGTVIQTDDATFHPPVDPNTSWDRMEKTR